MNQQIRNHLASNDDILKNILNHIPLKEIETTHNVFHDLMSCIIEQQIHYRSTKKTFQKILDEASIEVLNIQNFPLLEERGFQNLKLSMRKYETINRVVEFFEQNDVDWQKKEDVEVRRLLSQIKGIGPWTVDMILLYTLERPNIFPVDDYHLKKIMIKLYEIDTTPRVKDQLKAITEKWHPYKSFGVKYLLAWKDHQK